MALARMDKLVKKLMSNPVMEECRIKNRNHVAQEINMPNKHYINILYQPKIKGEYIV